MQRPTLPAGVRRRAARPVVALALVMLTAACLPGWRQQVALDGVVLDDIACTDATHCWAVGAEGGAAAVVATTDGRSWTRQRTGVTGGALRAVTCRSGGHCVAVGGSSVLQTVDGGATWTAPSLAPPADLADVSCTDAGRCVAAGSAGAQGENGALFTSADGGASWAVVASDVLAGSPLSGVDCAGDGCLAVASPRPGFVLWSGDAGVTWSHRAALGSSPFPGLNWGTELAAVDCLPSGACMLAGVSYSRLGGVAMAWRSPDWGLHWTSQGIAPGSAGSVPGAVACVDDDHCWVGGTSESLSTIWATGAASSSPMHFYGQFTGIQGAHTVTGLVCFDTDRCKATATTGAGSRIYDTTNGGAAFPVITNMTPDHGPSAGGTTVTLTGHGLAGATAVRFGSTAAPAFTVLADDRLTATVPPGDPAEPYATVSVVTPDGTATATDTFLHEFPLHLTSMSPTRCGFGTEWACDILFFEGTGIPPTWARPGVARVRFGTIDVKPDCQSTTVCYIVIPRASEHPELVNTVVPVTFETAGGSQTFLFTYGPVVDAITPPNGPPAGTTVAITGLGLGGVTDVRFGATAAPFTVVDDTHITATVPPGPADTQVALSLTNALGDWELGTTGEYPQGALFTYQAPPTITELVPPYGSVGTSIELRGDGLASVGEPRAVWFGESVSPYAFCYEGGCWVSVPPGTGTVPVRIETGGGTSPVTPATMFTYYPAPQLAGISPSSGPAAGGNTAVISGQNLADIVRVTVNGEAVTVVSSTATSVTIVMPPGFAGQVVFAMVTTRGGPSNMSGPEVTYAYT